MNKYITALLIVLATTGVEAQNYQSALKATLGDVAIEDLYHYQAFKDLEDNIVNILKSLNEVKEEEKIEPTHAKHYVYQREASIPQIIEDSYSLNTPREKVILPNPSIISSIFIRGPNWV